MNRARSWLVLVLLAAAVLVADKYYPYGPSSDEEDVYYAQNFRYINPHLNWNGSYVPGYYVPTRVAANPRFNPTPDYFPVTENLAPYSGALPGTNYFAPNPSNPADNAGYWPYFAPLP